MEQTDSIKGELQTLIALEQQQVETLGAIHSRGAFNPTASQVGGFGFGQSHYALGMGGFQNIPMVGSYMNQVSGALNYGRDVFGGTAVGAAMNNFQSNMRNAMVSQNLDSVGIFGANQSKMSNEAREMQAANIGAKLSSGALGAASIMAGTAGSSLGSLAGQTLFGGMFGGLAGSLLFGAAGGALVGGAVDIAADQVKQNYAYDRYLLQNSSKFINVFESNNDRNVGGFNRKERWDMSNWLRHFNTEKSITDDDTMTLLKGFTEGDLLREVSNVDQFKEKMSQLTDSIKSMALSLNETYENVAQMMADLKKKGIDQRDYKNIAATSKVIGGLTGQDSSEVMENTTDLAYSIAQKYGNAELDPDKILRSVQGTTAYIGQMYEKGDEKTRNLITNFGGQEAAASAISDTMYGLLAENSTQFSMYSAAFMDWDDTAKTFKFNKDRYNQFKNEGWNLTELANIGTTNLQNSGLEAIGYWKSHQGEIMQEAFGSASDQVSYIQAILAGAENTAGFQDTSTAFKLENLLGIDGAQANLLTAYLDTVTGDNGKLERQMAAAGVAQTMVSNYQSDHPGAWYSLKNLWGAAKDEVGDAADNIFSPFRKFGQWFSDKWVGKPVEDVQNLWMETDWSKNPFDDFDESMKQYQQALFESGDEAGAVRVASEMFGGSYSTDVGTRNVYNSIEELIAVIKNLTNDSEKLAEVIREASKNGNVSENTAAGIVKSLGITDPVKATKVINRLSAEIQNGATEEEATKTVLTEYGVTDEAAQNKVIKDYGIGGTNSGMSQERFLTMNKLDNIDRATLETSQRMLLSDDSVSVSALDIDKRRTSSPIRAMQNAPELYLNEMLGLGYSDHKAGDITDMFKNDYEGDGISVIAGITLPGKRSGVRGFTDNELMSMDAELSEPLRQASNLVKEFKQKGESSQWATLSQEERYNNLVLLRQGYEYYKDREMLDENFVKNIFGGINIDELDSSASEAIKKYMFVGDETQFYGTFLYGKAPKTWEEFREGLQKAQNGENKAMSGYADIGGKTVDEAKEWIKQELTNLNEDFKDEQYNFLDKEARLKTYIEKNYGETGNGALWQNIESGAITNMEDYEKFMSENKLGTNGNLNTLVSEYFSAQDSFTPYKEKRQALLNSQALLEDTDTKLLAYQTGFKSLGRVLGMDEDQLDKIEGELSTKFSSGDSKTKDQIGASVDKVRSYLGDHLFGAYSGQQVTEENVTQIQSKLINALTATGSMDSVQAQDLAQQFAGIGTTLTSDAIGDFTNTVMSSITWGENSAETQLKSAIEDNTRALEANTAALDPDGENQKKNQESKSKNQSDLSNWESDTVNSIAPVNSNGQYSSSSKSSSNVNT